MSVTTLTSSVSPQPLADVEATSQQHIPDLASSELPMLKIFSYIDDGKTVGAVSLASKNLKRLMGQEIDQRVGRLKKEADSFAPSDSAHDIQVKIDAMCDGISVQRVSIFNELRCSKFLEVVRAIDLCSKFLYFRCAEMTLDGISFDPHWVFSKRYYDDEEEEIAGEEIARQAEVKQFVRKFDEVSKVAQEKVHSVRELVQEYGPIAREICSLHVRLRKANFCYNVADWLRTKGLIPDEISENLKGTIEEKIEKNMMYVNIEDIFRIGRKGVPLELQFRLGLEWVGDGFFRGLVDEYETIETIMDIIDLDEELRTCLPDEYLTRQEAAKERVEKRFPGFGSFCKKKRVLRALDEEKWVEAAEKASAWLQKARGLGIKVLKP